MSLQYKLILYITFYSLLVLTILLTMFSIFSLGYRDVEVSENIEANLHVMTDAIEHEFFHYITLSELIASDDDITDNVVASNDFYSAYTEQTRNSTIDALNQSWTSAGEESQFVDDILNNQLSGILSSVSDSDQELYGEIFVTNKYGLMIGSSGRLSTLAHAHKYWWQGAYNDGDSKIYIDDRGYDQSVGEIVVGIVLPLFNNDEFIGMIKINIKVSGMLDEHVINLNNIASSGEYLVIRQNGQILARENVQPLTTNLDNDLFEYTKSSNFTGTVEYNEEDYYFGSMDAEFDLHDKDYFFGGRDSAQDDNSPGNSGDVWKVVFLSRKSLLNSTINDTISLTIYVSLGVIFVFIVLSAYTGNKFASRVIRLQKSTNELSQGKYGVQIADTSKDEIGDLAANFNELSMKLKTTTTSIDLYETEINRRKELEKELIDISRYDDLTKIFNRRAFNEHFRRYLSNAKRSNTSVGFIIFDIDDFKVINDTYGHQNGDKVLIALSESINSILREGDILCRWGGEEFVVLVPNASESNILAISEKILKHAQLAKVESIPSVTVSVGATMSTLDDTEDTIVVRADKAMYSAKTNGKNQVRYQDIE